MNNFNTKMCLRHALNAKKRMNKMKENLYENRRSRPV